MTFLIMAADYFGISIEDTILNLISKNTTVQTGYFKMI